MKKKLTEKFWVVMNKDGTIIKETLAKAARDAEGVAIDMIGFDRYFDGVEQDVYSLVLVEIKIVL